MALVLALAWGTWGYYASKPTDVHDYRQVAVQSAQSAYYSVSTMELTVGAQLDGNTLDPYVRSALDESTRAVAGAAKRFAGEAPVDAATTQMRDQPHHRVILRPLPQGRDEITQRRQMPRPERGHR